MRRHLALLLSVALAACASPPLDAVRGQAPSYLDVGPTGDVPNGAALRHRIWTPGLDEGYVSQGLASAGDTLYVSSYKPTPDLKASTGPCRVFQIDRATGRVTGSFGVPPGACTHAGGLAHVGGDRLLLADTRQLFLIDLPRALTAGSTQGAARTLRLAGELRGSYAAFDGRDAWIGTWTHDPAKARMYRLPLALFDTHDGQTIAENRATQSIPVPPEAQGAAFGHDGTLWVSASNSRWGRLYRLDLQGRVLAEHPMVAGLEDLAVDADGQLWGLSESGTRKYLGWATRFPHIFRIDTARLR